MGGLGSGSWYRSSRKTTVEEARTLAMRDLRRRLSPGASGTLTWTRGAVASGIAYSVTGNDRAPMVTLHYCWRDAVDICLRIRLTATATQFGGKRWWFICPLSLRGVACNRRVGKLYLPPGGRYFGCRHCYKLTYESCQQAHQTERLLGHLGHGPEVARMFSKSTREKRRSAVQAEMYGDPSSLSLKGKPAWR